MIALEESDDDDEEAMTALVGEEGADVESDGEAATEVFELF